jgi:MFS family permease
MRLIRSSIAPRRRADIGLPLADVRSRRLAISSVFLTNGIGIGVWAAFIPILKERLAFNDATLAAVLLCAAVGAIIAMPISGALCDRYGSARIIAPSATLFGVALGAATSASNAPLVVLAAFAMGAGNGAMDVAMNVNGVALQTRAGRPVMSSLHALFSVGTFLAAAGMARLVATRLPTVTASIAIALLLIGAGIVLAPRLTRDRQPRVRAAAKRGGRISSRLVLLGVAAICGAVSEGALVDWSGIYMRESLHVAIAPALGGFAAYAVAMSLSRFCGDAIVARIGPVALVRASGVLGATGLIVALVIHTYVAVAAGFFITGLGLGNVSPLVYGAGGDDAQSGAGAGVATVTTLGYAGFLIGPTLIGFTARRASIDVAFGLIAGFALAIALLAPVLRKAPMRAC